MKGKKKSILLLIMGLFLMNSINQGTATIIFQEDFEKPPFDDWSFQAYEEVFYNMSATIVEPRTFIPTVTNGKLQMPVFENSTDLLISSAVTSSTIAYGTWSFDWYVKSDTGYEHQSWDNVFFISDRPFNMTGVNLVNPITNAYILMLKSATAGLESDGENTIPPSSITFWKQKTQAPFFETFAIYDIPGTHVTGSHHIDITRKTNGEFNIYFDSDLIINETDIIITTSERVQFNSLLGDCAFDNITISDTVDVPIIDKQTSDYPHLIMLAVPIGVIIILRKKRVN